jgi:hypothetical protein
MISIFRQFVLFLFFRRDRPDAAMSIVLEVSPYLTDKDLRDAADYFRAVREWRVATGYKERT